MGSTPEFKIENKAKWISVQKSIFPNIIPTQCVWDNNNDIVSILTNICSPKQDLNHLLYPDSGGNDLVNIELSSEKGCIELDLGFLHIIKAKKLIFESFENNLLSSYFWLETDKLDPITKEGQLDPILKEEVYKLGDGHFIPEDQYNNYKDNFTDDSSNRIELISISRWLMPSSFLICAKSSPYNSISASYDGLHNKMSSGKFRIFMEKALNN